MDSQNSHRLSVRDRLLLVVALVTAALVSVFFDGSARALAVSLLFQTPLPTPKQEEPKVDPHWIYDRSGGSVQGSTFKVTIPRGFTTQGGAMVYVDRVLPPVQLQGQPLVAGTQLAIGIWPPNEQSKFDQPIALMVKLDSAQVSGASRSFEFRMYNPATSRWVALPSNLNRSTNELTTAIQTFTPTARNFPSWGGRSLIGVFTGGSGSSSSSSGALVIPPGSPPTCLVASSVLNLRSGPGTQYVPPLARLNRAAKLTPLGSNADREWIKVRVEATKQEGWIKTGQQYAICNVTAASLPVTR